MSKILRSLQKVISESEFDAYLIPHADEFQSESPQLCDQRLKALSGFAGSAGSAIVTSNRSALFVDGRYSLQARQQSGEFFEIYDLSAEEMQRFLRDASTSMGDASTGMSDTETSKSRVSLAYDPKLITVAQARNYKKRWEKSEIELISQQDNLIDRLWVDQPPQSRDSVLAYPALFAGRSAAEKIADVVSYIRNQKAQAMIISDQQGVAWLLNLRKVEPHELPVVPARLVIHANGDAALFASDIVNVGELESYLAGTASEQVRESEVIDISLYLRDADDISKYLTDKFSSANPKLLLDPAITSVHLHEAALGSGWVVSDDRDPTLIAKSRKNERECTWAREVHRRDGAALVRVLRWIDTAEREGRDLYELDISERLDGERGRDPLFRAISFSSIVGSGPNGALPHYRVTAQSNRRLQSGDLIVIDSGGQYLGATTDVTRTLSWGEATHAQKADYTRVLKGMLAVSRMRFPQGTTGIAIDVFSRQFLWQQCQDFAHGTGHGVGSYLSVHEGPYSLSPRGSLALAAGSIISNEPGFYRPEAYGIRIENLLLVSQIAPRDDVSGSWLEFETLNLAPIDTRLIDRDLLSADERAWLNSYHEWVYGELSMRLDDDERVWLAEKTLPI